MISSSTFSNFEAASRSVLGFLHQKLGFQLWMVARKDGDDWVVLVSEDHGYNVRTRDVFGMAESTCSQMVECKGPRFVPVSDNVIAFRETPIGQKVPIRSFLGVPLFYGDGSLFGTLCAIDPEPQPDEIVGELPMIELFANLLTSILDAGLKTAEQFRRAERACVDALIDPLTGLLNRRGWEKLAHIEEDRMRRYGNSAGVIYLDLDNLKRVNDREGHKAGDKLICRTADLLKSTTRESDLIARIGGDEFVVLAVECDPRTSFSMIERIQKTFTQAGIEISIGFGMKNAANTIDHAVTLADEDMYHQKQARAKNSFLRNPAVQIEDRLAQIPD